MKNPPEKRRFVGSLMDRLNGNPSRVQTLSTGQHRLDGDPSRGQTLSTGQQLSELKLSVRRDLENLLNTRRRCLELPPQCRELEGTLIDYGIPDFTGLNMSVPSQREDTRMEIERVIRRFEPRLTNVTVTIQANVDHLDRTLRLRISGTFRVKPITESLVFDSELKSSTGTIEVKAVP